jgi:acetolactate synthase-1/3 small subunit
MKRTLSILVENRPGVLVRVVSLFARRGYNIESLAVGTTENEKYSRITTVVDGDDHVIEQISKQLYKLIDVLKVNDVDAGQSVVRELAMIRVTTDSTTRSEIMQIVDIFRAKIVDVSRKSMVVEMTGDQDKISALTELLRPFGIKELVRTGKIAMARGQK